MWQECSRRQKLSAGVQGNYEDKVCVQLNSAALKRDGGESRRREEIGSWREKIELTEVEASSRTHLSS